MPRRARWVPALVTVVVCSAQLPAGTAGGQQDPGVDPYRGLGAWVDVFDRALYADPEGTVATLSAHGVRTLYLQTATYRLRGPLHFPDLAGRFLEAAHAAGMKVVAWYVPDFADLERDFRWSMAAVGYTSPSGERFDSFALDIEVTSVEDPNERASRLLELSRRLRTAAGPSYPLGAITPSPLRSPGYWPVFPDAELAQLYDVYLPMAYWSYHADGERGAYDYIARSAEVVRSETGRPDLPIHMIGGLADGAEGDESRGFVAAVNEAGLVGASLYDVASSGPEDWAALAELRFPQAEPEAEPEAREPKGLQLGEDLGTYGSIDGADRRFDREAAFRAPPMAGAWELDYEAFGIGEGGGALVVNGERVAGLEATGPAWGTRHTVTLPDEVLDGGGPNTVAFTGSDSWAVREVTAAAAALPLEDREAHGAIPASDPGRRHRVTYAFDGPASAMAVTVRGFDVAGGEVSVALDGVTLGWLPATSPRVWGGPATVVVEPERSGSHRLTFEAVRGFGGAWAVRLDAVAPATLA